MRECAAVGSRPSLTDRDLLRIWPDHSWQFLSTSRGSYRDRPRIGPVFRYARKIRARLFAVHALQGLRDLADAVSLGVAIQSTTQRSATGQRYIRHRELGGQILLFVRLAGSKTGSPCPTRSLAPSITYRTSTSGRSSSYGSCDSRCRRISSGGKGRSGLIKPIARAARRAPPFNSAVRLSVTNMRLHQNVAIGFNGNPVPPNTGTGAAVSRNSHRLRRDATCATASRSITSTSGSPIATIASW